MKKSKYILVSILAAGFAASLVACNPSEEGDTSNSEVPASSSLPATGATAVGDYVSVSNEEKTKILGALEKYAVDNAITGLPLFEDGGYNVYNERVVRGVDNYIVGYGFGTLREGSLSGTLTGEFGKIKPEYYHSGWSDDPKTTNYYNAQGTDVADISEMVTMSYFGTKASSSGKAYDWIGTLSKTDRPYIVNSDGTASEVSDANLTGTKWRIYVRTGEDGGLRYRTASTNEARKAYDGTYIQLEDYLTPFKILLTQKNALYRGGELANQTGKYGIKGAASYYNATKTLNFDSEEAEELWENVGIKSGTDSKMGDYLEFEFLAPTTRFYAMYALSSSLYSPIPASFWKLVTNNSENPSNWGSSTSDKSLSPLDNTLCLGPYYIESWEQDKALVFARDENYHEYDNWYAASGKTERTDIYKIPGVYWLCLDYSNNSNVGIENWEAGNLDASGVPLSYVRKYKNDPRAIKVPGSSVFKLNVNSCTQEEWEEKFGENGSVSHTARSDYYTVKPWMSNDSFVKGMFYAIDRDTFATARGSVSTINYFSSAYMSDPENGVSYNTTTPHAEAIDDFWGDSAETGGFSLSLSQAQFDNAIDELIAEGSVTANQTLTIDIWWMSQAQITSYGVDIGKYIEDAFNGSSKATVNGLTLQVNNKAVATAMDVYYKKLMVGQFDLGFGSISGNVLDPLNFMEVLKSNNSSGFCLNWGPDTSKVGIEYEGKLWSFDALWAAADHGVCTYQGSEVPAISLVDQTSTITEGNDLSIEITYATGLDYLKDKAKTDAEAQAIIDSGLYSTTFAGITFYDDVYGMLNFSFVPDGEGGVKVSGRDKLCGYTASEAFKSYELDETSGTFKIVVSGEAIEVWRATLSSAYAEYDYHLDRFVFYFYCSQTIGSLETSVTFPSVAWDITSWSEGKTSGGDSSSLAS